MKPSVIDNLFKLKIGTERTSVQKSLPQVRFHQALLLKYNKYLRKKLNFVNISCKWINNKYIIISILEICVNHSNNNR